MSRIHPLEVPAARFTYRKILPKYLIENLVLRQTKASFAQLDLLADFNGIKFEDMVISISTTRSGRTA